MLPIVCFLIGLCSGRMAIPPTKVIQAILSKFHLAAEASPQTGTVIWSMRIPRLLLACVVGCGLSIAGCTFQSLFSNPLATPDTLGVASGASFGAAFALLLGFHMIGVQLSALAFGIVAVILTSFSGAGLQQSRTTPILAGIMVGSLFNSFVSLIKFTADTESQLPAITYWLMGSLESAGYQTLLL
ncbi:MAG: iron chelate uptake ABC transporter family permease subunit, partial [Clostridia bacterium]|nr:iron chelate uptake ABC transporter family permease subunit [Clostridia bacterium]